MNLPTEYTELTELMHPGETPFRVFRGPTQLIP